MRARRLLPLAALLFGLGAATAAVAAGPPFPDPVNDQAVYDTAGALRPATVSRAEAIVDEVERASQAEVVVFTQVKPGISEEENLADARALMDQWGVGRAGFDDGLVLMIGLDEDLVHGRVSFFAGSGYRSAYLDENALKAVIDDDFVPSARAGDLDGAVLAALDAIQAVTTPQQRDRLNRARQLNAVLGLVVAPLALLLVSGVAYLTWRREGDDPEVIDSPSILMAGPPASMTPALATVVREGRATQHSINVTLLDIASTGRISFENLDQVSGAKSDDEPEPLTDPALLIQPPTASMRELTPISASVDAELRQLGVGSDRLSRERLWRMNDALAPTRELLEREAVRLGWLTREPTPAINRWTAIAGVELVAGIGAGALAFVLPASGLLLVGIGIGLGAIITLGFARAMSKRTPSGGLVDAMLKAYRRTLEKTLEQARSMNEVVANAEVAAVADTPDKAVVWGIALGLHAQVAAVLARSLEDLRQPRTGVAPVYFPAWFGTTPAAGFGTADAGMLRGGGGLFSGSGLPDLGGMFNALGSMGNAPPSSSSSSGGFGGGGSSGGGGASGSF